FNNPASARTNTDAMGIYRAGHPRIEHLDRKLLANVGNGIALYEADIPNGRKLAPRDRGLYYENPAYQTFALWVAEEKGVMNDAMLTRTGILAAMVADHLQNAELADEFWNYILNEDHPDPNHITRDLARTFKE